MTQQTPEKELAASVDPESKMIAPDEVQGAAGVSSSSGVKQKRPPQKKGPKKGSTRNPASAAQQETTS